MKMKSFTFHASLRGCLQLPHLVLLLLCDAPEKQHVTDDYMQRIDAGLGTAHAVAMATLAAHSAKEATQVLVLLHYNCVCTVTME